MTDQLTGLLSRPAFLTLVDRDRLLAERLGRKIMILVAECAEQAEVAAHAPGAHNQGDQRLDLALVKAADGLRDLAGPAALVARLNHSRFGLSAFDTEAEPVEEIRRRVHAAAIGGEIAWGAAIFDPHHPVSLDALLEQAGHDLHTGPLRPTAWNIAG